MTTPAVNARYYVYYAHRGMNQTALGVAFYYGGELAGSRFRPIDEAIRRGDVPDNELGRSIVPGTNLPPTEVEMEHRLTTMSNAMSMVQWRLGGGTTVWDAAHIQRTFDYVVGDA